MSAVRFPKETGRALLLALMLGASGLVGPVARAVQPDEILSDPAAEGRARAVRAAALHGLSEPVHR